MSSSYFPEFSQLPAWITTSQDLFRRNVRISSFVFQGGREALRGLCNDWFDRATGGKVQVKPYQDFVLISFVNSYCAQEKTKGEAFGPCYHTGCPQSELLDESGKPIGIFKYHSLHITLLVQTQKGQVYAFSPYSFIDDTTGIVYGRETFGQTMTLTDFYYSGMDSLNETGDFQLRMEADDVSNITTGLNVRDKIVMLELNSLPEKSNRETPPALSFPEGQGQVKLPYHLQKKLLQETGTEYKKARLHPLFMAGTGREKLISLRQFRGSPLSDRAVLKSVVSFIPGQTKVHRYHWLNRTYQLTFPDSSSIVNNHFPLRSSLGLTKNAQSLAAFEATLDFKYIPFKSLWKAR